jgi:hypothetical protein
MKGLCGLGFDKNISKEDSQRVEIDLKVPILNNIAICLMKLNKFERAN